MKAAKASTDASIIPTLQDDTLTKLSLYEKKTRLMSLRALLEDTTAYDLSPDDAALLEELSRYFPDESLLAFISQGSLDALALQNY